MQRASWIDWLCPLKIYMLMFYSPTPQDSPASEMDFFTHVKIKWLAQALGSPDGIMKRKCGFRSRCEHKEHAKQNWSDAARSLKPVRSQQRQVQTRSLGQQRRVGMLTPRFWTYSPQDCTTIRSCFNLSSLGYFAITAPENKCQSYYTRWFYELDQSLEKFFMHKSKEKGIKFSSWKSRSKFIEF